MDEGQIVNVTPDWLRASEVPVQPVNVFLTSLGAPGGPTAVPDGILLSVGYMRPPLLVGTPEDNARLISALDGKIPVEVSANYIMTRERALELVELLHVAVNQYDQVTREGAQHA